MKTLLCQQGSNEWKAARLGVVTASEVDALVTPLWKIRTGEGVETYLYKKLCEKLLGWSDDFTGTWAMDQGSLIETVAVPWYEFAHDVTVKRVGFCVSDDGKIGCSPDGLIGDDCGLEIKSPQPPRHLKYLTEGRLPPEYAAQVHFSMLVTGLPRWKFVSFSRHFDPLVLTIERDEKIQTILRESLVWFFEKFDPKLAKLTAAKDAENTAKNAEYEKEIAREMAARK